MIRATVGVGFKHGRLRYAYQILRGKDLETKETSPETREKSFETFGAALGRVLDLNNWHAFINTVGEAGYVSSSQIASENALMFNYALYLIGRHEFGMDPLSLKRLARRWFFASSLTGYYVGSFETVFERQLVEISRMETAEEFVGYFDRSISALLTDDYFEQTLVNDLDVREATGPSWRDSSPRRSSSGARRSSARCPSPS